MLRAMRRRPNRGRRDRARLHARAELRYSQKSSLGMKSWRRARSRITGRPMSETLAIADGLVVVLNYTLRSSAGEVIDASTKEEPLAYLHGADNIVPGLEQAVGYSGKVIGEPADGYGEREDSAPEAVPREAFPGDVELFVGMQLMAES